MCKISRFLHAKTIEKHKENDNRQKWKNGPPTFYTAFTHLLHTFYTPFRIFCTPFTHDEFRRFFLHTFYPPFTHVLPMFYPRCFTHGLTKFYQWFTNVLPMFYQHCTKVLSTFYPRFTHVLPTGENIFTHVFFLHTFYTLCTFTAATSIAG